jgi:hypothetical protein
MLFAFSILRTVCEKLIFNTVILSLFQCGGSKSAWIRIYFGRLVPVSDPGMQKWPAKKEKHEGMYFIILKYCTFSLTAGRLSWRPRDNKRHILRDRRLSTGPTRAAEAEQKLLLYWQDKPNEPTKEEPLSFVIIESKFTSVSIVNRGHPYIVSLGINISQFLFKKI